MHEVSLVADLVDACQTLAAGRPVRRVCVRHASSIPGQALEQAFRMLTQDGVMSGARLEAQAFDVRLRCACGFDGALGHDDLISGSVAVCPDCGDVSIRPRTAELELLGIETDTPTDEEHPTLAPAEDDGTSERAE
jgi:Zn finger protein HypA/HybF involved in hydrogenase expression